MSFRESVEKLAGVATKIANFGVEPKTPQPYLVELMSWDEAARLDNATRLSMQDFVSGDDGLIYLKDSKANRELIETLYKSYLSKVGTSPFVRQIILKNGQTVIDLPKIHAHREIVSSEKLRKQIPELFGEKPDEKGEFDFCAKGLENQEHMIEFALARRPSLHIDNRQKRSGSVSGRIENVTEDAIMGVKTFAPIVVSSTLRIDKELHQELKVASGQISGAVVAGAANLRDTINREAPVVAVKTADATIRNLVVAEALTETLVKPVVDDLTFAVKINASKTGDVAIDLTSEIVAKAITVALKIPKPGVNPKG